MRIALGADHAGVDLKAQVKRLLDRHRLEYEDFGPHTDASVDYPDYAAAVAHCVASRSCERGILICGSGIGMAIAANKVRGVRAAPITTPDAARMARRHNDANVLTLGARNLAVNDALAIVEAFLAESFDGGRHQRRVDKIVAAERAAPVVSSEIQRRTETGEAPDEQYTKSEHVPDR